MRSNGFDGMICSVADVMGMVGDRWGVLVLRDVLLGVGRYDDLRRSTGITNATLSDRLKGLTDAGLLERRPYQERPRRHEYVPTDRGRDFALVIQAMAQIGDKWRAEGAAGRPLRFVDRRTGHDLKLATVDARTGDLVHRSDISIEVGEAADETMMWRLAVGTSRRASRQDD